MTPVSATGPRTLLLPEEYSDRQEVLPVENVLVVGVGVGVEVTV